MRVPRGTASRLRLYAELLREEAHRQNLVAASTLPILFRRHIADSLQLAPLLKPGPVIDIGSGAGLPGLVVACVRPIDIVLIEPRQLRAEFLRRCIDRLSLRHATVLCGKIQTVRIAPVANILARAVMALPELFSAARHVANADTRWILPKGRSAQSELDDARRTWHGRFELVTSRTDPEARIVLAEDVRKRED